MPTLNWIGKKAVENHHRQAPFHLLNWSFTHLPKHKGPKVVYGTACRIGPERLRQENILFKQLPYKIRTI